MTIEPRASIKPSKSAAVIRLLSRAKGATSAEMTAATSWQPHTVRGYLTGLRKKGHVLSREARKSGESAYSLVESARRKPALTDAAPSQAVAQALTGEPASDAATTALVA